jgi:hypothetical protein
MLGPVTLEQPVTMQIVLQQADGNLWQQSGCSRGLTTASSNGSSPTGGKGLHSSQENDYSEVFATVARHGAVHR